MGPELTDEEASAALSRYVVAFGARAALAILGWLLVIGLLGTAERVELAPAIPLALDLVASGAVFLTLARMTGSPLGSQNMTRACAAAGGSTAVDALAIVGLILSPRMADRVVLLATPLVVILSVLGTIALSSALSKLVGGARMTRAARMTRYLGFGIVALLLLEVPVLLLARTSSPAMFAGVGLLALGAVGWVVFVALHLLLANAVARTLAPLDPWEV